MNENSKPNILDNLRCGFE